MVSNVQSLSKGVDDLTKKVNALHAAIEKVNGVSVTALGKFSGVLNQAGGTRNLTKAATRPGTGADGANGLPSATGENTGNRMSGSLGKFTAFSMSGKGQASFGIAQGVLSLAAGGYAATPDVGATLNRSLGYYQAGLTTPGINRGSLERATMRAMGGGISSVGSSAQVASTLSAYGYTAGSFNYLQAAAQVGGAYKYLGMNNAQAAQSIAGFQTGTMGANMYQYGISTYNPRTGKEKTPGQIAQELMKLMGGGKATAEQVRQSFQRGALGANLKTMGFDEGQQKILFQSMVDIASGRNPDLSKAAPGAGNANTALTSAGRMAASQESLMTKGENAMIKGFENAADTVEAFNRALSNVIEPLMQLKGYLGGVGGTNVGKGAKSAMSGVLNIAKKVVGAGLIATANPVGVAAGSALLFSGGGTSGYGAKFGNRGGGGPMAKISGAVTAPYGAQDSNTWASSGGKHTGVDYQMEVGTPVKATMSGVVSQVDLNSDYGTSILVDTPSGVQTLFAHLSSKAVKVGDRVISGQVIGKSGKSGNANGPHLHYEVRNGKNNAVDPASVGSSSYLSTGNATPLPTGWGALTTGSSSTLSSSTPAASAALTATADKDLVSILKQAGFTGSKLTNAYNIARAESGGRAGALNPNASTGDYSMGLFQINMIGDLGTRRNAKYLKEYGSIGYKGPESLYDPLINAKIAYDISKSGTKWSDAWVNSSKKLNIGGGSSGYGGAGLSTATAAPVVNNTFNIPITLQNSSDAELLRVANRVKALIKNSAEISMIGKA